MTDAILARLEPLGERVLLRRGARASQKDIARLERRLGVKFPDDCRAFLARIGALHVATEERASMYEDMFVYGHVGKDGPGDLDITRVRPDLEEWGSAPEVAVPILFFGDHSNSAMGAPRRAALARAIGAREQRRCARDASSRRATRV